MWYFAKPLRELRGQPITKIAEISGGAYVRISGVISGDGSVVAPVTHDRCSFVETEMREWDNGATYPFTKEKAGSFQLHDGSGEAWIECDDAKVALRVDERGHSDDEEVRDHVSSYVSELGKSMLDQWGSVRSLDWRERRLEPGDHVCVVGVAHHEAHPDGQPSSYRHSPARVVIRANLIVERKSCRCP